MSIIAHRGQDSNEILCQFVSRLVKVFSTVFSKRCVREFKQLAANKDIIVCKPDKGRGVVIIDKDTYVSRMFALISDALEI